MRGRTFAGVALPPTAMACIALLLPLAWIPVAAASVVSTTDPATIAAFQSGRIVLGFDELVVPAGPCYIPLDPNQYAGQGILITAFADGSGRTNLARLPGCGDFGPTLSPPNIIGGGTGPGSLGWRETVRFDFPTPANAIGASSDGTGSNTTLTAYHADGSVIASISGDQGNFMGIAEPDIAYATWKWNYDESVAGFSLDNITFSTPLASVGDRTAATTVDAEPNPFAAQTWIRWGLPRAAHVRVSVFDVRGRRVATLLDAQRPAGEDLLRWNATDDTGSRVPSGVYFVRVEVPGRTVTRRLVRLR